MLKATVFQDANGVISQKEVHQRNHRYRTNIIRDDLYHVWVAMVVHTSDFESLWIVKLLLFLHKNCFPIYSTILGTWMNGYQVPLMCCTWRYNTYLSIVCMHAIHITSEGSNDIHFCNTTDYLFYHVHSSAFNYLDIYFLYMWAYFVRYLLLTA